ncbi:radical SAM protein [Chitinophaga pendula]|uniref:radical SAM/SPASM domain-containing protein n=1 Tax=Chitinophaga TaxID=79328 RepID=UPI0018E05FE7|nr:MULTISPECIES: radical SAM protein [Chitinophaga]UCJ09888.1 radical SAM protein [Chitinophaga pendula]
MDKHKKSFYLVQSRVLDEANPEPQQVIFATRTASIMVIRSEYLQYMEQNAFEQIPADILSDLVAIEAIVPEEQDELSYILQDNQQEVEKDDTLDIVIQPGASCQLGCHYCGQKHSNHYMSKPLQQKMIDRIIGKLKENNMKELSITWYGAEPLMAVRQIREMSAPLLEYTTAMGIRYSANMVTNGLSLKENIFREMVEQWKVTNFQITLDGVAAYHDKNRYTKQNKPTFDIIFNNILNIVNAPYYRACGGRLMIRCNVDKNNEPGLQEFIALMAEHKLQEKVGFYVIPVHNWGDNHAGDEVGVDKSGFAMAEIDWLLQLMRYGFQVDILPERSKIVCSAVKKHSEVYDAFGTVSTCWEVPYTPLYTNTAYEIGHLSLPFTEDVSKTPMRAWNTDLKEGKTWCAKCNLLPVCGGSCPIHWEHGIPACPSFKFNIEDRLILAWLEDRHQRKVKVLQHQQAEN